MSSGRKALYNFTCSGSRGKQTRHAFVFEPPGGAAFRLSSPASPGNFGTDPAEVLIRGMSVACDAKERRFLIAYRGASSLTLDCLPPPY
jgi:hypothetical protein